MNDKAMNKEEPPPYSHPVTSSLFRVGRDSRGRWVVQDQDGLRGGLFVDRAHASKFAMFEMEIVRRPSLWFRACWS
jgi:hypothetical protein